MVLFMNEWTRRLVGVVSRKPKRGVYEDNGLLVADRSYLTTWVAQDGATVTRERTGQKSHEDYKN